MARTKEKTEAGSPASPGSELRLVAVGDIQPDRPDPEKLFELVRSELSWGDLRVGQLEATLSERGEVRSDVRNPAHRVHPSNVKALTAAGFDVITFAGNNNLDYGTTAFFDTIKLLKSNGIAVVGAGRDLSEAQRPVVMERARTKIAFVAFCSILPPGYAAMASRPGISPLRISTFYEPLENIYEQPGTPSRTVTLADPDDLLAAKEVITTAKRMADIVVASFHWGVHFTHDLAMYQPHVAYSAIDAGADLVLGSHPHCLQAIEVYKGKVIFYSLGNFAFEQRAKNAHVGVASYLSYYGLPIDPELPQHPHPQHCRKTLIAQIAIRQKRVESVHVVPVYFGSRGRPEPLRASTPRFEDVMGLIEELSGEVGTRLAREGDRARVVLQKETDMDARALLAARKMSYPWLHRIATELVTQESRRPKRSV